MGELTQSFAQVTNAINQTKQQNLNRDVAQANFSFRQQANDLANRQFDANQKQREFDNQMARADKSFDMASKLLEVVPQSEKEGLVNGVLSAYAQVTGKQYSPLQLMKFDETRAQLYALGDEPDKQAEVIRRFEQQALPGDPNVQRLQNEYLMGQINETRDNTGSLTGLHKLGRVMSQSAFDRAMDDPDKDMARALQAKKENGEINIVPDKLALSLDLNEQRDARYNALDPNVASKLLQIELGTLDPSMLSGDKEVDELIATNNYLGVMDEIDAMIAANKVPPMSKYREAQRWAKLSGGDKLPSPVVSPEDREKMLASQAKRDHLTKRNEFIDAQINETNIRTGKTLAEVDKIVTQIDNIKQDTANDKIAGEAALLGTQAQRRALDATSPEKIQRMSEIDQELEEISKVQGNPSALNALDQSEVEGMEDRMELLKLEKDVLENTIALAGAKDPSLVLQRSNNLKASTDLMRQKITDLRDESKGNGKELNGLQLSRLASVDQKRQQDQATFQQEQDAIKVAQEGARREIDFNNQKAVQKLADELGANAPINLIRKAAGLPESEKRPLQIQLQGPERSNRALAFNAITGLNIMEGSIKRLRPLISPEMFGAAGKLRKTVFGLVQQGDAFGELLMETSQEMAAHARLAGSDKEVVSKFSNSKAPAAEMLMHNLTYMVAAMNDPKDRVSNEAYRDAEKALGLRGLLSNMEDFTSRIDQLEVELKANKKVWGKLLGEGEADKLSDEPQQGPSLPDMSEATDEDLMNILKGAFQ